MQLPKQVNPAAQLVHREPAASERAFLHVTKMRKSARLPRCWRITVEEGREVY
jgi:hypothetical protein